MGRVRSRVAPRTAEKHQHLVNILLFGRLAVYRALRAAWRDVRGRDPFLFADEVPEVWTALQARFPGVFGAGARPSVSVEVRRVELPLGDPGLPTVGSPDGEG